MEKFMSQREENSVDLSILRLEKLNSNFRNPKLRIKMTDIMHQDLQDLLIYFGKNSYRARDADNTSQAIMQKCILLTDLDYTHYIVNNYSGELSAHYPSHLIILENEKHKIFNVSSTPPSLPRTTETIYESMYDGPRLKELIRNARFARCRSRFPLPVILYKGRHVCRSATISGGPEIYGRSGFDYLFNNDDSSEQNEGVAGDVVEEENSRNGDSSNDWQLFDRVRQHDIKLLKTLNVGTIIDLMVEKKKVKFGMYVTSSEKVDKVKRYSDFNLISLPYPGCEFFKEFRGNNYVGSNLKFDWTQSHIDAEIGVPDDSISNVLHISWDQYRIWDLTVLTQNYFKLIIRYLCDSSNGLLIHCISGWDRTPLFISLLRLSLWADGVAHTSLNSYQMLYYTIAYDWMLFGHDLADRLSKGEDIFFFCFYFIKYILEEEYSVHNRPSKTHNRPSRNDSDTQLDNVMFDNETGATASSVSSNLSLNSWVSLSPYSNGKDIQDNNSPSQQGASSDVQDDSHNNGNNISWSSSPSSKESSIYGSPSSAVNPSRTSPVAVPTSSVNRTTSIAVPVPGRVRQRNESISSGGGSWQMISGTGSLRGTTTANAPLVEPGSSDSCKSTCQTCGSYSKTTNDDGSSKIITSTRKERLQCLRRIFYLVYSKSIGFPMNCNLEYSGIGYLIANLTGTVEIGPRS